MRALLRLSTMLLLCLAILPARRAIAEEGDRSCSNCYCGDVQCLVTGWIENSEGGLDWAEDFWKSACVLANQACADWAGEGGGDPE